MKTNIGVEKGVRQKEGFDELWARFMKWTKLKREMKIMTSSCCHSVNTSIAFIVYDTCECTWYKIWWMDLKSKVCYFTIEKYWFYLHYLYFHN